MRRMILMVFLAAVGTFVVAAAWPGAGQESPPVPDTRKWAEELWEKAIAAKGGRERLHQVETFAIFFHTERGKFSRRAGRAYQVGFYRFPDKWWNWSDMRPSPLGVYAEVRSADEGPNSRHFLIRDQVFYLMETRWLRPVPVSARKEVLDGVRVDVVRTELQDEQDAEFFLDPKTHLPMEVRLGKREEKRLSPWFAISLSDYASCQGIQMPRTDMRFKSGPGPVSYEINPEYDEKALQHDPRPEDGPEAWRPKGGPKAPVVRCN